MNTLKKWLEQQYNDVQTLSSLPTTKEKQKEYDILCATYERILNKIKELKGEE